MKHHVFALPLAQGELPVGGQSLPRLHARRMAQFSGLISDSMLLAAALSLLVSAGTPKPVTEIAAAIDGAKRSDGKKECTFTVEKPECSLAVRVTCATPLMKYSYVMTLPLGKLDPKKSVYEPNAGGFAGSHGVELNATGDVIETVTDDGQKRARRWCSRSAAHPTTSSVRRSFSSRWPRRRRPAADELHRARGRIGPPFDQPPATRPMLTGGRRGAATQPPHAPTG